MLRLLRRPSRGRRRTLVPPFRIGIFIMCHIALQFANTRAERVAVGGNRGRAKASPRSSGVGFSRGMIGIWERCGYGCGSAEQFRCLRPSVWIDWRLWCSSLARTPRNRRFRGLGPHMPGRDRLGGGESSLERTRLWVRVSLLAGKIQGISRSCSLFRASAALENAGNPRVSPPNSLTTGTGKL